MNQPVRPRSSRKEPSRLAATQAGVRSGAQPKPFQSSHIPGMWRSTVLLLVVAVIILYGLLAAAYRQLYAPEVARLQDHGEDRYNGSEVLPAQRGLILDRNRAPLALNQSKATISLVGSQARLNNPEKLQRAASILGMGHADLLEKITQAKDGLVYLKRQVDIEEGLKIRSQLQGALRKDRITGIYITEEFYRYYPQVEAASQLIGTVNLVGKPLDGLELSMNTELLGVDGTRRFIRTGIGSQIEAIDKTDEPIHGTEIQLTIHKDLQHSVYSELRAAVLANEAVGGSAVMLDAKTGEILALANYPSYDPNKSGPKSLEQMRNRAATDPFEPGSTMKPFTMSLALEKGKIKPNAVFSGKPFKVGPKSIDDGDHGRANLTLPDIMQHSSNVGTVRISQTLNAQEMYDGLSLLGFGKKVNLPLRSDTQGRLREPHRWADVDKALLSYGYGTSVSVLQLARAYTVFTNDGLVMPLSLIKTNELAAGKRVMRPEIATLLREYMELVTNADGTAPCASVENFRTAGKTGTAKKWSNNAKGYREKYIASFAGFAPASAPRVVVAVMIDEPSLPKKFYGGIVAAPAFSNIVAHAMRVLNVPPDGGIKAKCTAPRYEELL